MLFHNAEPEVFEQKEPGGWLNPYSPKRGGTAERDRRRKNSGTGGPGVLAFGDKLVGGGQLFDDNWYVTSQ
jgi:hypothetical protein